MSTLATTAQQHDDTIVDRLGSFYAQHPTLVKTLGVAALGAVMSHMSQHRKAQILLGAMMKRVLLVLAMAGIYVWIRRQQQNLKGPIKAESAADSEWANEGGANPAPSV